MAGALVTKLDGGAEVLIPPYSVLAANPKLYELMSAVIRGEIGGYIYDDKGVLVDEKCY